MRCVKGIDELYEEVKDFELVITNDAALATALNGRIDRPVVGFFAMTPKQIAAHLAPSMTDKPLRSELEVISSVSKETGFSLRYVHSEIENFKEIRRYTKEVDKYLYSLASREIYDSYEHITTLERIMGAMIPEEHEFFRAKVAVIQEELFDDLDKHFIPLDHESISIFKKGDYEIDKVYEVGNDRQLADNAVDLIDPERASDYAIVLNTASPITDAVRAALYRRGLPFINALSVRDLSQIRDYLQFITLAMDFDTIRVKHVKELFSNYNGSFRKGRDGFLLSKQTESDMMNRAYELWQVMRDIRSMTYAEVCESICDKRARIQVSILIKELGVEDTKITATNLGEVRYAVDNVSELRHSEEIPENEKKGVLLVDCSNSVYIDRPVVIYLGMEQDWNRVVVGKPYIDVEDETDRNVDRLQALLQQGDARFYLVNSTKNGKTARPCMLFDLIYGRPVNTFQELCPTVVKGRWHEEVEASIPEDASRGVQSEERFDMTFAKSSFDNYYSCPRKFMYGLFLTTPEAKSTEFGTLIHSFAEFYTCYPQDVRERGVEYFADLISDRYSGLSSPMLEDLDRSKIRLAMTAVMQYIDMIGVKDVPLDVPLSSKKYPNRFMLAMGKEYTSSVCEVDQRSSRYPIHGQMDLFWQGAITDYKTGSPSTAKDIAAAMTLDSGADYPEFQAPIYLALSAENGGYRGEFDLFYAMDNDAVSAMGQSDISSNIRKVKLSDKPIVETMTSSSGFRQFLHVELSQDLRGRADDIMDILAGMDLPDPSEWDGNLSIVNEIMSGLGMKDTKTNRQNVERGVRKIASFSMNGLLSYGDTVEVTPEYMERTMDRLTALHSEMVEQSRTGYPAAPRIDCKRCQYFQVCTKEVIDLGGDSDE